MRMRYHPCNYPQDYATLPPDEREACALWISKRLRPAARKMRAYNRLNSYGLKHIMEREIGLYTTNGQFKGAMEAAGYEAYDTDNINWTYNADLVPDGR